MTKPKCTCLDVEGECTIHDPDCETCVPGELQHPPAMELRVVINQLAKMAILPKMADRMRLQALELIDRIEDSNDE